MNRYIGLFRMLLLSQLLVLLPGDLLQAATDARRTLNVSIVVFDPGVPADQSLHRDLQVFPRIREVEAKFLPFVLREALAATNDWGAVRVVPEADVAAELLVSGSILRSDGENLQLQIRAVDASGRLWLDTVYTGIVADDYAKQGDEPDVPGYQELYDQIADDLKAQRNQRNDKELTNIVNISLLRYAKQLAPTAFGDYLNDAADGTYTIQRLPAENDPMLDRIERIRGAEYVITDAVDGKYQELNVEIASIYDLWRDYRRKGAEYRAQDAMRVQNTRSSAARGSYEALKTVYDNYKFDRIIAQEQDNLAVAFNNEVGPTVVAMEARVGELEGWVDQQYAQWHRLLEELFEVETGIGR